jgi:arabinose-5-phosphate isomerase
MPSPWRCSSAAASRRDFRVLHPGGKLGRSLIKVSDLMHGGERLPLTGETTSVTDAVLATEGFGCVGIVDRNGGLIDRHRRRPPAPAVGN